jgi:glycosyltransferase involved in cell wall biosynthesis
MSRLRDSILPTPIPGSWCSGDSTVSVVVPVFDEEKNVESLHDELSTVLASLGVPSEIVFVDDGSQDGTLSQLVAVARKDPRVRVLQLSRNCGQTAALQAGFDHARGEVIVTLDGDLQNDPRDIPRLLAEIESGFDVVSGWRRNRKDRLLSRRLPSMMANWIVAWLTGVKVHDHGCALKAYRRGVTDRTSLYSDMHRFIVVIASMTGGRCREIVVNHRARRAGRSKYGLGRVWKVLLDLMVLVTLTRFATRPARWFLLLSLPFAGAGALFVVAAALAYWSADPQDTSPIVLVGAAFLYCFAAGHFVLLAILGELIMATGDYREIDSVLVTAHGGRP